MVLRRESCVFVGFSLFAFARRVYARTFVGHGLESCELGHIAIVVHEFARDVVR